MPDSPKKRDAEPVAWLTTAGVDAGPALPLSRSTVVFLFMVLGTVMLGRMAYSANGSGSLCRSAGGNGVRGNAC